MLLVSFALTGFVLLQQTPQTVLDCSGTDGLITCTVTSDFLVGPTRSDTYQKVTGTEVQEGSSFSDGSASYEYRLATATGLSRPLETWGEPDRATATAEADRIAALVQAARDGSFSVVVDPGPSLLATVILFVVAWPALSGLMSVVLWFAGMFVVVAMLSVVEWFRRN